MAIGFIGLGNLGSAISKRLDEMNEDIIVYNRSKEKADLLGFKTALSPKDLLQECDTIFLCLFDSKAVFNTLKMKNGLLENNDLHGKTIIDLTTHHYNEVLKVHELVTQNGGKYLESPVFGSVAPALKGELTIVCSGDEMVFNSNKPLLEKIAKEIFHLPHPSNATKMKLINNLCLGSFMTTIAECTALGEACNIDKTTLLNILGVGGGQSLVLKAKTQKLIDEDFSAHFSNDAIAKDLHCLQDLAFNLQRPLYSAAIPKELFSKMKENGEGSEDFSSIYKLFKN